jgi:hypothetical protein
MSWFLRGMGGKSTKVASGNAGKSGLDSATMLSRITDEALRQAMPKPAATAAWMPATSDATWLTT